MYKQCKIEFKKLSGVIIDIIWVEDKYAVVGKELTIAMKPMHWQSGWIVTEVYDYSISKDDARNIVSFDKYYRDAICLS